MANWHASSTGNHQGLVIDATTGANIAVIYDKAHTDLIAAAPDLLSALETMVETFGNSTVLSDYGREQVKTARAAIAKAKGE